MPTVMPPIGPALTPEQELACAFRILAGSGFAENLAGHITWSLDGDTEMFVNPWGLWWSELRASDICRVDADARVTGGRWDVTPAIHIHTELHRSRGDARVIVHNHPYWCTVLAALGLLPEVFHQTACLYDGEMVLVDEYDGEIDDAGKGAALADRIGGATIALLVNHGVLITGATVPEAVYRAVSFDRQCRLTYDVLMARAAGVGAARVIDPSARAGMQLSLLERATEAYWAGAVRGLLHRESDVLL
ncbi:MAG: class II aldolase/adducin family protein [Ilumatobacteraceae bacterium]